MSYHSVGYFAAFLPAVLILYTLTPKEHRWISLLGASLVFFALWSKWAVIWVFVTALLTWYCGNKLAAMKKAPKGEDRKAFKKHKKRIQTAGVISVVLLLAVLKYTNFFGSTLFGAGWVTKRILVPVGISYYTLQAVSYMTDIADGKYEPAPSFWKLLLYLCFFPTLAEGPIVRFPDVSEQYFAGNDITYVNLTQGYQRILWGLFKKMVIADHLSPAMSSLYTTYKTIGSMSLLAMLFCTIQIYTDFSGTIDIAIGTAQIFGIRLTENFRQPFFAKNAGDFWRRWHITLGVFLRTYIFYPVSLSKPVRTLTKKIQGVFGKKAARYVGPMIALLCVWLTSGIWHGPEWTYVGYGLYYFAVIFVEVLLEDPIKKHINENALWFRIFRFIKLCVIVGIGELYFMAPDAATAFTMFGSIFTNFRSEVFINEWSMLGPGLTDYMLVFFSFAIVIAVSICKEKNISVRAKLERMPSAVRWTFWYAAVFYVLFFGAYGPGFSAIEMMYAGF